MKVKNSPSLIQYIVFVFLDLTLNANFFLVCGSLFRAMIAIRAVCVYKCCQRICCTLQRY